MTPSLTIPPAAPAFNPVEMARVIQAFHSCSADLREIALKMSAIVANLGATDDERVLAADAMILALFPGTAEDVLNSLHSMLRAPVAPLVAAAPRKELTFGDRLRMEMEKKGVTLEQLALAAGIGPPAVANILIGRYRPQKTTVVRFAALLKMEPKELLPSFDED